MSDQSAQKTLPEKTQNSEETATHCRAGFEPADLRLRPRGHRDVPKELYC